MMHNTNGGATIGRSSLHATTGRIAAVATALFLVLFLVLSVSRASFSASTANENNFVTTDGIVELTDNDQGSALFELSGALPGVSTTRCIHVQYTGEFTSGNVNMYATVADQTAKVPPLNELAPYLDVTVRAVQIPDALFDVTNSPDCTAFTTNNTVLTPATTVFATAPLSSFPTNYATGKTAFAGTASTYAFEVTVEVQDTPEAANARADWNFTWETQSN